jgi:DNA primase catalytic subunit
VALLCALIVHKKKASKLQREHNSKIRRVLEVITEQVDLKRLKMYDQPEPDNETAISSLRALSEFYPDDVAKDLQQIEALWFKLGEQLKEFTGHPVKSTIQSSVLTTRAMKVADRICELVDSVNKRLG